MCKFKLRILEARFRHCRILIKHNPAEGVANESLKTSLGKSKAIRIAIYCRLGMTKNLFKEK